MTEVVIPLYNNVLIEPAKESEKEGGLFVPENAKEKPQVGKVVEVGPGVNKDSPMIVKAGDKVVYKKWAGHEIKALGGTMIIVEATDILAILKEEV